MPLALDKLTPPTPCDETELAQRFLASACESVNGVLASLDTVRGTRSGASGGQPRGRLSGSEEDLLRAAVLFGCAGLDATLKQVIRDALPGLLQVSGQAHEKFEIFVTQQISLGEGADPAKIAKILTSANPRADLIEQYIRSLTGSSLQSAEEVDRTCGALGIADGKLRKRAASMRDVFRTRNEISHELDLQKTEKRGDRSRRSRSMSSVTKVSHEALEVGQLVLNGVAILLHP